MSALQPATIKGYPWRVHLKREGAWEALCGRKPGNDSPRSSMRRAGWSIYKDTVSANCKECIAAHAAMTGSAE